MLKSLLKKSFEKFGYNIQKIELDSEMTMSGALKRCVDRGLNAKTVVDVGASNGSWSRACMKFLPSAKYLLIEAQEGHRQGLDEFVKEKSNAEYALAAAGSREGKIYFDNSHLFGGLASDTPFDSNCIEVPVVTIDAEVAKRKLEGPFLIKLDTHGFEIPILEGAIDTLKKAELVIIETYNYQLTSDSLKYFQMCAYMAEKGFSTIEMVDFKLRKHDSSFWQMDTFFIPSHRKEFDYNSFN